ncbi:MAG: PorV/PorQ family protein [Bacteroidia bacterium]|nr:PorV/PorQ family protein [Bacteroidia bacterium]
MKAIICSLISSLTFLKIDVSPRAAALAGSLTGTGGDSYAIQWNPAAMADIENLSFATSNTFWVAGINHSFFGATMPTKKIGTFGFSAVALNAGSMERRTEFQPNGTGEYFHAYNVAAGISYAKKLTEMFSYGLSVKYVNETLDNFTAHTGVIDLGFLYRTDFKDLKFAVLLQSFGLNSKLSGSKPYDPVNNSPISLESYPSPTVFSIGVSMLPIKTDKHTLLTALQLNHPNDNSENIRIGIEYVYSNLLAFRTGLKINVKDQPYPTLGLGVKTRLGKHPMQIDYAVDPLLYLGWIHRIGISLSLNRDTRENQTKDDNSTK